MELLPIEVLHVITATSEGAYRAMLAMPAFARSVDVSARYDYMLLFGYGVVITDYNIIWTKNSSWHRTDGPAIECASGACEWWEYGKFIRSGKNESVGSNM